MNYHLTSRPLTTVELFRQTRTIAAFFWKTIILEALKWRSGGVDINFCLSCWQMFANISPKLALHRATPWNKRLRWRQSCCWLSLFFLSSIYLAFHPNIYNISRHSLLRVAVMIFAQVAKASSRPLPNRECSYNLVEWMRLRLREKHLNMCGSTLKTLKRW